MRTPVMLGLLALSISFFANTAVASSVEDCEPLKEIGNKSLYGLCVAWHHADDEAKAALAAKFDERAGDFTLEEFLALASEPIPEPEPEQDFFCPCWSELSFADICALGAPTSVSRFGELLTTVRFAGEVELTATTESFSGQTLSFGCAHTILPTDGLGEAYLYVVKDGFRNGEELDCLAEADYIAVLHLDPICTGE